MRVLKIIERATGAHIRRELVPTAAEAEDREVEMLEARLLATLAKGGWGRYRPVIEELLQEDHDPVDLAAAALALMASSGIATRRPGRAPLSTPGAAPVVPRARPAAPAARESEHRDRPAAASTDRRRARPSAVVDDRRPGRDDAPWDDAPKQRRPRRDASEPGARPRRSPDPGGPARGAAGLADAPKGKKRGEERWQNQAPERKPRRLVTGSKAWERRPKPGAPARGPR
jgi:hypothetical protein